ncbi:alpha/beta hydrolase [Sphingomonas fennica]|uniref:Alpha/beta hydrolase n=1 Tax=Edaphosphingomonas fennica TaxID=114404 RepID=A0A2T4HN33_9SPHN|nr:alpha/beta fold hydrolase [Sphingomonas fennica]PTD17223.1 alpha/beta hydrolase [Sphingomonas fennica]
MTITRHFIRVGNRRVHYRKAGSGPTLLMVHQSPRSSAEYEPLMERWGRHFTCIAPDTPGFGQSDPLPGTPDIADFSAALVELLDALGIERTAAYGFHSGGIILIGAVKRHPDRFTALATGGYAVWTPEEMAIFDRDYLPPFRPSAYGEHLAWLWNRIIEQTWFFPWFDVRDAARIGVAHDDPVKTDAVVRDMLDSGDAYRAGYGAVLRAPRDIPPADAKTVPVLIAAYDGDPLQAHIARLGEMPPSWRAEAVATPADLEDACLAHLRAAEALPCPDLAESRDGGFVHVAGTGFDGLIRWRGDPAGAQVLLHAPGREADLLDIGDALGIDLPGHGLSDGWQEGFTPTLANWAAIVAAAIAAIAEGRPAIIGEGFSALLAAAVAARTGAHGWGAVAAHIPLPTATAPWIDRAIPDQAPDRFGAYLIAAWGAVRAGHFFWPWFEARAANAIPFAAADIAPDALAAEHRALIRARAGKALLATLATADRDALVAAAPAIIGWETAGWAGGRNDIWSPHGL